MQRYDSYKDSGIQWLGEIPSHWEVRRVRMIVTSEHGISYKPSDITDETGVLVLRASNIQDGKLSFDDNVYVKEVPQNKKLKKGDIILCATNGSLSLVGKSTIIDKDNEYSFGTFMLALRTSQSERFINYQLGRVIDNYRGLFATTTINQITQQVLGNMSMALPPLPEQQAIASYLDTATAKIDEAIAQQQKMIDLLNERKQIIINNAVTKGLNPNTKMKPSGIDWIGQIPEHWDETRLKYIFSRIADGTHFSPETKEEGMPYITATDVKGKGIGFSETKKISLKDYESLVASGCKPLLNDILLVKDGATTGRVGLMTDNTDCVTLSSVAMLTPQKNHNCLYLMYMMMSDFMQKQISLSMAGAAMPRITLIKLSNFVGFVPSIEEQESIATYIEETCAPIDFAISNATKQIALLQERKQIIINDVVTGKVKVI